MTAQNNTAVAAERKAARVNMRKQDMIGIHIGISYRADDVGRGSDRGCAEWRDGNNGNRWHFWVTRKVGSTTFEVEDDRLFVNPPEDARNGHTEYLPSGGSRWVPADERYFKTKVLNALAKVNRPLVWRALAVADFDKALAEYDAKRAAEKAQREQANIAAAKQERLEKAAPKMLAALKRAWEDLVAIKADCDSGEFEIDPQFAIDRVHEVIAEVEKE